MHILITLIPIALVLFIIVKEALQTWKDGLLLALIKLGISMLSVVLAFFLTRLLLDPARVDLFGLGKKLVEVVPAGFMQVDPSLTDFLQALPTALAAILGFTLIFDGLRLLSYRLLRKLNAKYDWSGRFLKIRHEKLCTMGVGALTSVVCLLTDLVILCGTLTFSGNMLYCAKAATGEDIFSSAGDVVHMLEENPVIRLANSMGAQELFFQLTMAQRDGEPFSVGEEMIELSDAFVGMLPVFEVMPKDGQPPTARQLRQLPEALGDSPRTMTLLVGMVRSYETELAESDAVLILSGLIGTTPSRFEDYLAGLSMEEAHEDLTTFCQIAALLAERELLPEEGEDFDLQALEDPQLLALAQEELAKNPALKAALAP